MNLLRVCAMVLVHRQVSKRGQSDKDVCTMDAEEGVHLPQDRRIKSHVQLGLPRLCSARRSDGWLPRRVATNLAKSEESRTGAGLHSCIQDVLDCGDGV